MTSTFYSDFIPTIEDTN